MLHHRVIFPFCFSGAFVQLHEVIPPSTTAELDWGTSGLCHIWFLLFSLPCVPLSVSFLPSLIPLTGTGHFHACLVWCTWSWWCWYLYDNNTTVANWQDSGVWHMIVYKPVVICHCSDSGKSLRGWKVQLLILWLRNTKFSCTLRDEPEVTVCESVYICAAAAHQLDKRQAGWWKMFSQLQMERRWAVTWTHPVKLWQIVKRNLYSRQTRAWRVSTSQSRNGA